MATRGRKSQAALSVVSVLPNQRPEPDACLTSEQKEIWRAVVSTKPHDWWSADSVPLLISYCKAITEHKKVSEIIEQTDIASLKSTESLKRYDRLTKMQDRQARLMTLLATKMRLSQQSRYNAQRASTQDKRASEGSKPWHVARN